MDEEASANHKPAALTLGIDTGMLESLGLNMYTSVGKSLVEFVANGYDADASEVSISVPFEEIDKARAALREKAKTDVKDGKRDKFTVLEDPLPEDIKIVISDNGHGMHGDEVQNKYLMVNRNRREKEGNKSESGKRCVMGRKGLGKLAGFGTAERITIRTKRAGEKYATEFAMDFAEIKKAERADQVRFTPTYFDNQPEAERGTVITLSRLRCDAIKAKEQTIRSTLAQNFAILGEAFSIRMNGTLVEQEPVEYEFKYPEDKDLGGAEFGTAMVEIPDVISFPITYRVMFRARKNEEEPAAPKEKPPSVDASDPAAPTADTTEAKHLEKEESKRRGSLPARLRGARIYCNKRLAAGPSLFDLPTGMHNFHSQSYMECVVHADELDRHKVDHISTNRTDLKSDNEIVDAVIGLVTDLMKKALAAHAAFRDEAAKEEMDKNPVAKTILGQVEHLSRDTRVPAKKALTTLAARHGVESRIFQEVAPLVVRSMNTGEVLVRLAQLGEDPRSIDVVSHELVELARIEHTDALKLYRGRRNGIIALQKLQAEGEDEWRGKRFEGRLHVLLKGNPWLIETEFSRFLTSDSDMGNVVRSLDKELGIDTGKREDYDPEQDKDATRPDLVFVLCDAGQRTRAVVVELKSPNLPLTADHMTQLEGYIVKINEYLTNEFKGEASVLGYLIGTLPDADTKNTKEKVLLSKYHKSVPSDLLQIIPLTELLDRAKKRHADYIDVLKKEEERLDEDLS